MNKNLFHQNSDTKRIDFYSNTSFVLPSSAKGNNNFTSYEHIIATKLILTHLVDNVVNFTETEDQFHYIPYTYATY